MKTKEEILIKALNDRCKYESGKEMDYDTHLAIMKAMEEYAQQQVKNSVPDDYDSGLLNDYGGGDVEWWQGYIREEVARCNGYWRDYLERSQGNER